MHRFLIIFFFTFEYHALQIVSFLVLQSSWRGKRADCFTLIVFLMYFDCLCSLALPHGDMGWSAVCKCKIILIV